MPLHRADLYRLRFDGYLRFGTPIDLPLERKDDPTTGRYVWRTRHDPKVRPTHRENEGRIFSWDHPPETGNPGEEPNCRCEAIPYRPGETEFAYHTFTSDLSSPNPRWGDKDFMGHFWDGGGRAVTLWEIGHLAEIANVYAYETGAEGAFRRLANQIADKARKMPAGSIDDHFERAYDFGSVAFSHGNAVVKGDFLGTKTDLGEMFRIEGNSTFEFSDVFTDPLDFRERYGRDRKAATFGFTERQTQSHVDFFNSDVERSIWVTRTAPEIRRSVWEAITDVGGTAYDVTGNWTASFVAEVFVDASRSVYFVRR